MDSLIKDLRYGARMLLKRPGFALAAIITLGLGVGANTAIFSVVYGVLLKPLPYRDAERIVVANVSPPDFRDIKAAARSIEQMAIWASNLYNVTIDGETTQTTGAVVSPDFLPMLSQPALGRFWQPEEDSLHLCVISHDYWQSRFSGDVNVIGKTINLYGKAHTITGVMPPEFQYPTHDFKLWTTFGAAMAEAPKQAENRQFRIFRAVAKLKPDVTMGQMQAEMDAISQRLQQEYPESNSGVQIRFTSLYERIVGDVQRALWVLLATVGFVLLIACANVANLSLSRMAVREREIAIRTALGAGRWRVLRQLMTESLLLALIGALLGLLLAFWSLDALLAYNPENLPRLTSVQINTPVLLYTIGASILSAITFGLAPAWQIMRGNLNRTLREGGRGAFGNLRSSRFRNGLAVIEIALAVVVLTGAGLLLKSFNRLVSVDTGFVADHLLTAALPLVEFKEPHQRANIAHEVIARISQIPGVQAVSGGSGLPPQNAQRATRFAVQGVPTSDGSARSAYFLAISPDYFRALGSQWYEGREFNDRDHAAAPKVLIINRTMARKLFPNESAIGKRLQLINPEYSDEWREVVGVAGDVRYQGLDDPGEAAIYAPFAQTPFLWTNLMIRTQAPPQTLVAGIRGAVTSVDPGLTPMSFRTMDELVFESVAQPRFYTVLLGAFALLALALAVVGIYGVISCSVEQRTHEFGVRMALGARSIDVVKLVLRQGGLLLLMGIAFGIAGALATTRLLASLLFEVSATDPTTIILISLFLTIIALLACWIPARRATRVDPVVALRQD